MFHGWNLFSPRGRFLIVADQRSPSKVAAAVHMFLLGAHNKPKGVNRLDALSPLAEPHGLVHARHH